MYASFMLSYVIYQVNIQLHAAGFRISEDCGHALQSTSGLSVQACKFSAKRADIKISSMLLPSTAYSITLLIRQPLAASLAGTSRNTMDFGISDSEGVEIEVSPSPVEISSFVATSATAFSPPDNAGVTGFTVVSQSSYVMSAPASMMTFSFSWAGTLDRRYVIEISALPAHVWDLGSPGSPCQGYDQLRLASGTTCEFITLPGGVNGRSNGFLISVGDIPLLESANQQFKVTVKNPPEAVNMFWVAVTKRKDSSEYMRSAFSAVPVVVVGKPRGSILNPSFPSVDMVQHIDLQFFPGNTLMSTKWRDDGRAAAGWIVISPPLGFSVVSSFGDPVPIDGLSPLRGAWTVDTVRNVWTLAVSDTPVFGQSEYGLRLFVRNPSAPQPAFAWSIVMEDGVSGLTVASTRAIRGIPIYGIIESISVSPVSARAGATASVNVRFSLEHSLVGEGRVELMAPFGYVFDSNCCIESLGASACKGEASVCRLYFSSSNLLRADDSHDVELSITNHLSNPSTNEWSVSTFAFDNTGVDFGKTSGFELFETEFEWFHVVAESRTAGLREVRVFLIPSIDVTENDYLHIVAPAGITFGTRVTLGSRANASVSTETGGAVVLRLINRLEAGIEYSIAMDVMIPISTPAVNRWRIRHTRRTGKGAVANLASASTKGFESQSIVNIEVVPYDTNAESWRNQILFAFSTTSVANGSVAITAPPGFSLVCPARPFRGQSLDGNQAAVTGSALPVAECVSGANRESAELRFANATLVAGVRYAFLLSALNPLSVSANEFRIASKSINGDIVEEGSVSGFPLSQRMPGSQILLGREDRRAGFTGNKIVLSVGIAVSVVPGSVLTIEAPIGFNICGNAGTCAILPASFLSSPYLMLPINFECACRAINVAIVKVSSPLIIGVYGAILEVQNPIATPKWNYWRVSVTDPMGAVTQSDPWLTGFPIQEVKDVSLRPLNQGRAIVGEAAVNPIEIVFTSTSPLPAALSDKTGGIIQIFAPEGFVAPLKPCERFPLNIEGVSSFPEGTVCYSDMNRTVTLKSPAGSHIPAGRYGVRIVFENPSSLVATAIGPWSVSSRTSSGDLIDLGDGIPGFPVFERIAFFSIDPSTITGSANVSIAVALKLSGVLQPGQAVTVVSPAGVVLGSPGDSCVRTSLPDFVSCSVQSSRSVRLVNTDPVRHGRSLAAQTSFSFLLENAANAPKTPLLNLWSVSAFTSRGDERWATTGYAVQPQLEDVSVKSSNPALSQSTEFTLQLTTVSPIDSGGKITVKAPGFRFGPTESVSENCQISVPHGAIWSTACPVLFTPCMANPTSIACMKYSALCASGDLHAESIIAGTTALFYCTQSGAQLTIEVGKDVLVPSGALLSFSFVGVNAASDQNGEWTIETRNSFSGSRAVDKSIIAPVGLFGVVQVDSLSPATTKVSSSNNRVTINFTLSAIVKAPSRIEIQLPIAFTQNIQMIMDVEVSGSLPRNTAWKLIETEKVQLDCEEDSIPGNEPLGVSLIVANPNMAPPDEQNLWRITASSNGTVVSINNRILGFRVYAEFESISIAGRVLSPSMVNTLGISFILASDLQRDNRFPASFLEITFPEGYSPVDPMCGQRLFSTAYTRYDGADLQLSTDRTYVQIPSGSICRSVINSDDAMMVMIDLDGPLMFGIEYAFQVGVVNPKHTPNINEFAFKTIYNGVALHTRTGVRGVVMHELQLFEIFASNPTKGSRVNTVSFDLSSSKAIPGSSTVTIRGPAGFELFCKDIQYVGFSASTFCDTSGTSITISLDKDGGIVPNQKISVIVPTFNPQSTPRTNLWSVEIKNREGFTVDVRTDVPGFDVTGRLTGSVSAKFVYTGQRSIITARFSPSTIQTRAMEGNQILVVPPSGFRFESECQSLSLRAVTSQIASYPIPEGYLIPTSSLKCGGFENGTLSIAFARGYGLQPFEYELTATVVNANTSSSRSDWTILTRSPDLLTGALHVSDFNSSIPGYALAELSKARV